MNMPAQYRPLEGSERYSIPGARFMVPADPNEHLSVTIVVRRRSDAPALPNLEYWQTTPPEKRTLFSREAFVASYGAAEEDLQRVADFARSKGLTVEGTSISRRTVAVSGNVEQFNNAFAVQLGRYESPDQTYRGREGPIYVPAELVGVIEGVFGLDNRRIGGQNSGVPTSDNLTLPQVTELYHFPSGTAAGQTIGILTFFGGYRSSDIQTFFNSLGAGYTAPTIVDVNIDNASNQPGTITHHPEVLANDSEVLGDICVASAVAQGAKIAVYFAPWSQKGWVDAIGRAVHPDPGDPTPSVLSTSWFISNGDDEHALQLEMDGVTLGFIKAVHTALQEAASLHITVFASSGDNGSDSKVGDRKAHVQYPGSDPWVTSCGGTTIATVSGSIFTEVTWNDGSGATGGGVSDFFSLPPYQSGVGVPNSIKDNHQGRGVPDVAGNASGYAISVQGTSASIAGTSAVAPLYAGLIAQINATLGKPTGFLNPTLYTLGASSGVFNDINDGISNARSGAPGYSSGPGWDACTGWGSINGQALLEALRVVKVRVHIDSIREHVPGTAEQMALVHPYAKVKMGNSPYLTLVQDGDFEGFESYFSIVRTVPIVIEIWRSTGKEVKQGQVETINGQTYIVFGPHEKYSAPAGWERLTPAEQAHFTTIIIQPQVSAGFVRRLTLTYDLRTHHISGDAIGSAGQLIHVPPDSHNALTPEIWFTISQI
jgi:kumamolisin